MADKEQAPQPQKAPFSWLFAPITELFGLSQMATVSGFLIVVFGLAFGFFWFFHSAPSQILTISSGPPGSIFNLNAERYRTILARSHLTLNILPSEGAEENLLRLNDPSQRVDIGFVQSGVTNEAKRGHLVSLGSLYFEPMLVLCRCDVSKGLLSVLAGKRVAVGPVGSGTRALALDLLKLNGIEPDGPTTLLYLDSAIAAKTLIEGGVDAVFMMGDSASSQIMKQLVLSPGVQILSFAQADGYTRKFPHLNKMALPMGSIDFGKNIPPHDVVLIGPAVELIARPDLHPAVSDLLLEAAKEVHGIATILRRRHEFPAPLEHEFPISMDATRFYKSGKSFLYRYMPFWLASLVNRVLLVFVPLLVVLIPGVRIIPTLFKWRVRLLIYRRYRALLALEREVSGPIDAGKRNELLGRLDQIEGAVNKMKVPASFADQFYGLRNDISFVRNRLAEAK